MASPDQPTRLAGVIGWPVGHSRSPALHGEWLRRHGINGRYVALPVHPDELAARLKSLPSEGFVGANLTIPHKETSLLLCDTLADSARRAGAVNTLVFRDGAVIGSNTDGDGFIANLRAHGVSPARTALVLGAGGAARAIGAALQDAGAAVVFCNRSVARAEALAAALDARVLPWERRGEALGDFALLVNATSLGMRGQPALEMQLARASADLVVADIVYAPLETPLLAAARARGLIAVEGLGMLLHQAVAGFAAWFGVTPEVDEELYRVVAGA
jgi:shikimate dehydrogenase